MILTLILIRHAKSSWDDDDLDDHDRPLNKRGRKSADNIGAWLVANEACPDQILCSTARRASDTWARMARHFPDAEDIRFFPELYHASARTVLETLKRSEHPNVMLIGHNPGIAMFAAAMCKMPSPHPDYHRYPTCATALIQFDNRRWSDVQPGTGDVLDFIVPRQLG
ncbi:MAG: histidine phosphatase family protein [Pseudomonadota bacterium]